MDSISASANAVDTRPVGRRGAPLGNTAKSSPPPSAKAKRAERYEGLSVARVWLSRRAKQLEPRKMAGDVYRTVDCRYMRRERDVGVNYSAEHQTSHYTGLVTCGSVWACPVCCALVQQRRRLELAHLISWSYSNGFAPMMVTLTFPHTKFDSLADLRAKQAAAFKILRQGTPWTKQKNRLGYVGLVRSLELTHGDNGWHPHTHELWIVRPQDADKRATFERALRERWYNSCVKAGLVDAGNALQRHAFMLHAVDVRWEVNDSDYLAKQDASRAWGADREIVTASSKRGRRSGVHPHEFLIRRGRADRMRYLEYIDGMKGASQLFWSSGLKKLCAVEEISDEALAQEEREHSDELGRVSADQWKVIRRRRLFSQLLDVADTGDWGAVWKFLIASGCDPYG
jgi:hypothetical protein